MNQRIAKKVLGRYHSGRYGRRQLVRALRVRGYHVMLAEPSVHRRESVSRSRAEEQETWPEMAALPVLDPFEFVWNELDCWGDASDHEIRVICERVCDVPTYRELRAVS